MKISKRLDVIQFDGVELYVNDALKELAKLPVVELVNYLKGPKLYSRRDHATILKNVMKDEVWKFKLVSRVADKGLSHDFYSRLNYFEDSPVTVLQNLFEKMVKIQPELLDDYLEDLWLYALQVVKGKDKELVELFRRAKVSKTSKVVLKELFPTINVLFADESGCIDGVPLEIFTSKAMHAATLKEIRVIGEKNDVILPTNLTKQDILDNIYNILPKVTKPKDLEAVKADVNEMTISELKEFVEKYKLDVPTELRKSDIADILVRSYVNRNISNVQKGLEFNLPERVDIREDFSDEHPKISRLNERIKELEKDLEAKQNAPAEKVIEKEIITVIDSESAKKEKEKRDALSAELEQIKVELSQKPKEVIVKVPGPTVVRTVISKKELEKQKEMYEALLAEKEKERALLISRVDEQEQYAKTLKEKEAAHEEKIEKEIEEPKMEEEKVRKVPVVEEYSSVPSSSESAVHARIDRLIEKIHELEVDILKRELELANRRRDEGDKERETEVNLYFDSNLAKRMIAQKGEEEIVERPVSKKKRKKVRKHRRMPLFFRLLITLIIIGIIVFMAGWLLQFYGVMPLSGPAWLATPLNATVGFLYTVTEAVFTWFRSIFAIVASWFGR